MSKILRVVTLLCCLLLAACEQELLKGLDQRQANEVLAVLQQSNIPAKKQDMGKTGYTIQVDQTDFARAVELLKTHELPSKPRVEISEMFPADSLATSPRAEKARLYSAIEQRLEQSLLVLPSVVKARLHISYDVDASTVRRQNPPAHLSVLVVYRNVDDETVLINQIKRFLKNSLDSVDYDDISVVLAKSDQDTQITLPVTPKASLVTPERLGMGAAAVLILVGVAFVMFRGKLGKPSSAPDKP